jgi:hypothetical protein
MVKKIVFLVEYPFSKRDYDRFGIETLKKERFDIEVWDFTPFLHKEIFDQYKDVDSMKYEKHCVFLSRKEASVALLGLDKNCFVICHLGYRLKTLSIYRALSKKGLGYSVSVANAMPIPVHGSSFLSKMLKIGKIIREPKKAIKKIMDFLFFYIHWKFIGIRPAALVLLGGEKSFSEYFKFYPIGLKSEKLWLHTLDYDLYLQEKESFVNSKEKTAVFLDEYVPFHPDYIPLGVLPFSTAEEYYPPLCAFFDNIEKRFGFKIIIAVHPRSNYERHPDYFGGRQVVKGKTVTLIRESEFVIAHSSTSINMAVLFEKPVIFITTVSLQQSLQAPYINLIASLLGKKVNNISRQKELDLISELKIDKTAYRKYKNDYIKKDGSLELPFWRAFSERVKIGDLL